MSYFGFRELASELHPNQYMTVMDKNHTKKRRNNLK